MAENKFIQVWDYILRNDHLDHTDVLLMSMIISMNKTKEGCYITNRGFCEELNIKNIETISRRLNKLEKKGYIKLNYIPHPENKNKTKRFIIPTYEKGLTQKSIPLDSTVNPPLTDKSIPLDSRVNTPLDSAVNPPLTGESINNINLLDNKNNINKNITNNKKEDPSLIFNTRYTDDVFDFIKESGLSSIEKESIKKIITLGVMGKGYMASQIEKDIYLKYHSKLKPYIKTKKYV